MNIFVLSRCPKKAAMYQVNSHVVKMVLESCQLLCSAHHNYPTYQLPDKFYKLSHQNHPCSSWTRWSTENYSWLATHAIALCEEYTYRYGKIHASQQLIEWCRDHVPNLPFKSMSEFALAMPDEYKRGDAVKSYRAYYFHDKRKNIKCEWTRREPPYWWNEMSLLEESK